MTLRIALLALLLCGCDSAPLQHCRYGGHWDGKAWHCMAEPEPSPVRHVDGYRTRLHDLRWLYRSTNSDSPRPIADCLKRWPLPTDLSWQHCIADDKGVWWIQIVPTPSATPSTFMGFAPALKRPPSPTVTETPVCAHGPIYNGCGYWKDIIRPELRSPSATPTPTAQPPTFMGFAPLYHGGIPKTRPTPRDPHPW